MIGEHYISCCILMMIPTYLSIRRSESLTLSENTEQSIASITNVANKVITDSGRIGLIK